MLSRSSPLEHLIPEPLGNRWLPQHTWMHHMLLTRWLGIATLASLFINRVPIMWYSKRLNTVKASTFLSEFIIAKCCVNHITLLHWGSNLGSLESVPVTEPTNQICDNESVVKNSIILSSTLNWKHSSITYHSVRWTVAVDIIHVAWVPTDMNLTDLMIKRLTVDKREKLFGEWTY